MWCEQMVDYPKYHQATHVHERCACNQHDSPALLQQPFIDRIHKLQQCEYLNDQVYTGQYSRNLQQMKCSLQVLNCKQLFIHIWYLSWDFLCIDVASGYMPEFPFQGSGQQSRHSEKIPTVFYTFPEIVSRTRTWNELCTCTALKAIWRSRFGIVWSGLPGPKHI